jgi:hypothetical protein
MKKRQITLFLVLQIVLACALGTVGTVATFRPGGFPRFGKILLLTGGFIAMAAVFCLCWAWMRKRSKARDVARAGG